MLRILHTEASRGWGGQEIRILSEISAMQRRGHRMMLCCAPDSELAKRVNLPDLPVVHLPFASNNDIDTVSGLHHLVRRHHLDVVNTHSSIDSWCAAIASVVLRNTVLVRTRHLSIPVKRNWPTRWLYRQPHAVVTTGEALRVQLIEQNGLRSARTLSIPTGIELGRFDPRAYDGQVVRRELGIAPDEILIGTVAMLRGMKGHRVLIDSAPAIIAKHPKVRFLFVGYVTQTSTVVDDFKARMRELGVEDRFVFAGYRTDIPNVLAALDMVVLPSTRDEGVPQSLTQALCMAKPTVATRVGAVGEIVRHQQTGLLVAPSDSGALGEAICTLIEQPELAKTYGDNGRQLVLKHYGIESMIDATERLYARLLAKQPAWPDTEPSPHESLNANPSSPAITMTEISSP
jgi:glycosyltransferase involved in cell wall biosynthesis